MAVLIMFCPDISQCFLGCCAKPVQECNSDVLPWKVRSFNMKNQFFFLLGVLADHELSIGISSRIEINAANQLQIRDVFVAF